MGKEPGRKLGDRLSVQLAVVELHETRVHDDSRHLPPHARAGIGRRLRAGHVLKGPSDRLGGLHRSLQGARDDSSGDTRPRRQCLPEGGGLPPSERGEGRIDPSHQEAVGIGLALAVPGEDQHR